MAKVIFGMTMSLDGFINDANGSGALLSSDFEELMQSDMMQDSIRTTGAVVMGRRTFEMAEDPDSYADVYEYQVPIFVITHNAPAKKPKGNDRLHFTFLDNVEAAIEQAKQTAGDKDVTVVGGPNIGQQLLMKGLVDELQIDIMPVLLGAGQRLFDNLEGLELKLNKTHLIETEQRTSMWFTVQK